MNDRRLITMTIELVNQGFTNAQIESAIMDNTIEQPTDGQLIFLMEKGFETKLIDFDKKIYSCVYC